MKERREQQRPRPRRALLFAGAAVVLVISYTMYALLTREGTAVEVTGVASKGLMGTMPEAAAHGAHGSRAVVAQHVLARDRVGNGLVLQQR